MKNKNNGFTLIELIIVTVVVAILASVSVMAYSGVQKRSRDVERMSDIRQLARQLEIYNQQKGFYPPYSQSGSIGLNFASWRNANIGEIKDAMLTPPGLTTPTLVNSANPTVNQYGYINDSSCVGSQCARYRLYWRSDTDGSVKTHVGYSG